MKHTQQKKEKKKSNNIKIDDSISQCSLWKSLNLIHVGNRMISERNNVPRLMQKAWTTKRRIVQDIKLL